MRNLLLIVSLFGVCNSMLGQVVDTTLGDNYIFEEVYQCGDRTKQELYEKSKTWIKRNLKSADNLIEFDEAEKNTIIVSGNLLLADIKRPMVNNRLVEFKLNLFFKDGRVKYILDNIVHHCNVPLAGLEETSNHYSEPVSDLKFTGLLNKEKLKRLVLEDVDIQLKKLLLDYKTSLTGTSPADSNDW